MTTDPTDLRQRITDIATPFFANFSDEESAGLNAGELADALAALLPLADRAAVLREAVERLSQVPFASVLTELRRLADEAQQPEPDETDASEADIDGMLAAGVPVQVVTRPPDTHAAAPEPEPSVHGESVAHLAGLHDDEPTVDARQDGAQDRG